MAPAIAAALISGIPAALKGIQGLAQGAKGSKLAKKNIRPTYEIPQEFQQNLAIAENMGRVGLPQQQYTQGLQNIQRSQTAGLRQLGRMGRGGSVAGLARAGMDATLGLDVADANARMSNQRAAMGYRSQIGQQQLAKQQYDKFGRYEEDAAAAEALKGAGRQNVMGGLSDLANIGMTTIAYGDLGGGKGKVPKTALLPKLNPQDYLNKLGMPNPNLTTPMSGYPFTGTGSMSNEQKILQKVKGYKGK
jgi:hypothetical protein